MRGAGVRAPRYSFAWSSPVVQLRADVTGQIADCRLTKAVVEFRLAKWLPVRSRITWATVSWCSLPSTVAYSHHSWVPTSRSRGAKRCAWERNCRSGSRPKRQLPRAKLRTEASRGMIRAPTLTASIRPTWTSRLTVLSLTSPRSACVALIEISSGSSAKRLACRSFTGLTSPNDLRFSRMVCNNHDTPQLVICQVMHKNKDILSGNSASCLMQLYATICNNIQYQRCLNSLLL